MPDDRRKAEYPSPVDIHLSGTMNSLSWSLFASSTSTNNIAEKKIVIVCTTLKTMSFTFSDDRRSLARPPKRRQWKGFSLSMFSIDYLAVIKFDSLPFRLLSNDRTRRCCDYHKCWIMLCTNKNKLDLCWHRFRREHLSNVLLSLVTLCLLS